MNRSLTGIVDEVVYDSSSNAAFEERIALAIGGIEVPVDDDLRSLVMNERALRVLALCMS